MTPTSRPQAIGLARRRARSGSGSDLAAMLGEPPIMRPWWRRVDEALKGIPHAVIGGVAAVHYMPPRTTRDIDVAVATTERVAAERALIDRGYRRGKPLAAGRLAGRHFTSPHRHPVDLIYLPPRLFSVITSARRLGGMPVAALPWLAYLKLEAGRLQDTADLGRMLGHQDDATIARVRRRIRQMGTAQDLADLDQIIELGRLEYNPGRPRRSVG